MVLMSVKDGGKRPSGSKVMLETVRNNAVASWRPINPFHLKTNGVGLLGGLRTYLIMCTAPCYNLSSITESMFAVVYMGSGWGRKKFIIWKLRVLKP